MAEEPLDLYDADPTGDSWRESLAKEPEAPAAASNQVEEAVSAEPASGAEPEIRTEPSFDDWFAQPAVQEASPSNEPALEDFAPDLTAAAPPEQAPPAADVIEEFTWSFTETERVLEPEPNEQDASVEASAPQEPEIEFTPWSAPSTESADDSAAPPAEESHGDEAWSAEPLPSLIGADDSPVEGSSDQVAAPGESPSAPWQEPIGAESPAFADIEAAFEDHADEPAETLEEPAVDVPSWAEASETSVDGEPVTASHAPEEVDDIPGIASLNHAVDATDPTPMEEGDDDLLPVSLSTSDPIIGRTPSFVPVVSEESSAAFVTETMAELYLQQGFYDEALSIYRQLLARNPNDATLSERVRALEEGTTSAVVDVDAVPSSPAPGSESARAFFARFANRGPTRGAREGNGPDRRGESTPATTVPLAGAAMPDEALTRPDEPSLTSIFSDQQVPAGDAQAARTLASAFGTTSGSAPRSGELSLQQLFRDVPARSSGAVTLGEQGTGSSTGASDASQAPGPDAEAPADYEQFTAWLEGLKKK